MPDSPEDAKQKQVEISERLQLKWLQRMEKLLDEGTITSTDLATIMRFLTHNGWTLDPSRLPKGLRSKLTQVHPANEFPEDGETGKIIGTIAQRAGR